MFQRTGSDDILIFSYSEHVISMYLAVVTSGNRTCFQTVLLNNRSAQTFFGHFFSDNDNINCTHICKS